jgi:hypothetical protein
MNKSYFNKLDVREFEYDDHIIVVAVHREYIMSAYLQVVDYTLLDHPVNSYYRLVTAYAFENKDQIPSSLDNYIKKTNSSSLKDYAVKNSTTCRIRQSPIKPDFEVPSDPTLYLGPLWKLSPFHSYEQKKRQKKDTLQSKWSKKYYPEGPHIDLVKQLEETLNPVLEEVSTQYELDNSSLSVNVDVTLDEFEGSGRNSASEISKEISEEVGNEITD